MLRGNSIWWSRVYCRLNRQRAFNSAAILSALRNNAKSTASADRIRDFIMGGLTTLFIVVGLILGVVVMWIGLLAVSIWFFLFMLTYLS
jgi:hypothetical protein